MQINCTLQAVISTLRDTVQCMYPAVFNIQHIPNKHLATFDDSSYNCF